MTEPSLRVDKWLWQARFFKSRALASKMCTGGKLRINDVLTSKAHYAVKPGDVLTFPKGPDIRVIKIVELGTRRGPATEAQMLYEDLSPPTPHKKKTASPATPAPVGSREPGSGRPTKADRRALDKLRDR